MPPGRLRRPNSLSPSPPFPARGPCSCAWRRLAPQSSHPAFGPWALLPTALVSLPEIIAAGTPPIQHPRFSGPQSRLASFSGTRNISLRDKRTANPAKTTPSLGVAGKPGGGESPLRHHCNPRKETRPRAKFPYCVRTDRAGNLWFVGIFTGPDVSRKRDALAGIFELRYDSTPGTAPNRDFIYNHPLFQYRISCVRHYR
jgi:hypothetical protein